MNPQQYYQYQLAASAGIPRMPMYAAPSHYVAGGVQLSHLPPPPPPPALAGFGLQQDPQQVTTFAPASSSNNISAGNPGTTAATSSVSGAESINADKVNKVDQVGSQKSPMGKSTPVSLGGTTNTTTMMAGAVQPTSMIMPSGQTPSLISGVYAGAYIQQAIPQHPTQVPHPQYMFAASAGIQHQQQAITAAAPQPKFMFVPQLPAAIPQPIQQTPAGAFMQQPTLFQDQSGKYYMLNSNQVQQPAFNLPQQQVPGKPPLAQPAGQQYIASQYYYPQMQAQASFPGGVICDPRAPPGSALATAIQQTQPGAASQQQYHYY